MAAPPLKPIGREKYMTKEELDRLRAVCRDRATEDLKHGRQGGVREWMVIDLASTTGLRVSELAALDVGEFFPGSKRPYLLVKSAKKRQAEREEVPLALSVVKHLEEYLEWRRVCLGENVEGDAPLLASERRKRYSRVGLQQCFKAAAKRAGLDPHYSIHSLRHTLGFHLLRNTKNLRLVQKQLRHASPQTTAAFYADVAFEDQQDALNGLFEGK